MQRGHWRSNSAPKTYLSRPHRNLRALKTYWATNSLSTLVVPEWVLVPPTRRASIQSCQTINLQCFTPYKFHCWHLVRRMSKSLLLCHLHAWYSKIGFLLQTLHLFQNLLLGSTAAFAIPYACIDHLWIWISRSAVFICWACDIVIEFSLGGGRMKRGLPETYMWFGLCQYHILPDIFTGLSQSAYSAKHL